MRTIFGVMEGRVHTAIDAVFVQVRDLRVFKYAKLWLKKV
jgi:hypothetical protein